MKKTNQILLLSAVLCFSITSFAERSSEQIVNGTLTSSSGTTTGSVKKNLNCSEKFPELKLESKLSCDREAKEELKRFLGSKQEQGFLEDVASNNVDRIMERLNCGANGDFRSSSRSTTPLIVAVVYGYIEMAEVLICAGASIDEKNLYDDGALVYAVISENYDMTKLLLDAGASIDEEKFHRDSALMSLTSIKIFNLIMSRR